MKYLILFLSFFSLILSGCIQDDVIFDTVDENVRITSSVDTLAVGDTYIFEAIFTNNIGQTEERPMEWISSDPEILSINDQGEARGIQKGEVEVIASINLDNVRRIGDTTRVAVADETVESPDDAKGGTIRSTSSYKLTGTFSMTASNGGVLIEFEDDYEASRSLPGLYVYLTNNPSSISGAHEIGKVEVFDGAHSYTVSGVDLEEYTYLLYYCKPFRVKVGDGKIE